MNSLRNVVRSLSPFTRGRKTREQEAAERALYEESRWQSALSRIDFRDFLQLFYEKYNPEKLDTIDMILHQFAGKESDMILVLGEKYELSREQLIALMDEAAVDNPAPGASNTRYNSNDGAAVAGPHSEYCDEEPSDDPSFENSRSPVHQTNDRVNSSGPRASSDSSEIDEKNKVRLASILAAGAQSRQGASSRPELSAAIASAIDANRSKNRGSISSAGVASQASGPSVVSGVGGKRDIASMWMSPFLRSKNNNNNNQAAPRGPSPATQKVSEASLFDQTGTSQQPRAQEPQPSVEELREELQRTRHALQAAASEKERMNELIQIIASNPDNVSGALRSFLEDNGILPETQPEAPQTPEIVITNEFANNVSPLDMGSPAYSNNYVSMRARNRDPPHTRPTVLSSSREFEGMARAAASGHISPRRGEQATSPRFMMTAAPPPTDEPYDLYAPNLRPPSDMQSQRSGVLSSSPATSHIGSAPDGFDSKSPVIQPVVMPSRLFTGNVQTTRLQSSPSGRLPVLPMGLQSAAYVSGAPGRGRASSSASTRSTGSNGILQGSRLRSESPGSRSIASTNSNNSLTSPSVLSSTSASRAKSTDRVDRFVRGTPSPAVVAIEQKYKLMKKHADQGVNAAILGQRMAQVNLQRTASQINSEESYEDEERQSTADETTTSKEPPIDDWKECFDAKTNRKYYYSPLLKKSVWRLPADAVLSAAASGVAAHGDSHSVSTNASSAGQSTSRGRVAAVRGASPSGQGREQVAGGGASSSNGSIRSRSSSRGPSAVESKPSSAQERPRGAVWIKTKDPKTGRAYWYHSQTRETTWADPSKAGPPTYMRYGSMGAGV